MFRQYICTSIAFCAALLLAVSPVSTARAEPSNAEIAAGAAAAILGGVFLGKQYKKYKEKKEDKKIQKRASQNYNQFQKDFAGDKNAAAAKWGPKCQAVKSQLQAANCNNQSKPSRKCIKIAAECPL